jgi:predicted DNA-binding transcriptional regulator AlpA
VPTKVQKNAQVCLPGNSTVTIQNEILTPKEVAALLRTSLAWVYEKSRRRNRDPLPCYRIGRYCRYTKSAVLTWMVRHGNSAAQQISKAA